MGGQPMVQRIPAQHREAYALLQRHALRLHTLIESGEFYRKRWTERRKLIRRVTKLYRRLVGRAPRAVLAPLFAAAGVVSLSGFGPPPIVPRFGDPIRRPFGLSAAPSYVGGAVALFDVDGDGDVDALGFDYDQDEFRYQENVGGSVSPRFASPTIGPFGLGPQTASIPFPVIASIDIDSDGDEDIIVSSYSDEGVLCLIENIGTTFAPAFAADPVFGFYAGPAPDPGGEIPVSIAVGDIDDDGDDDIIFVGATYDDGGYVFRIRFVENNGGLGSFEPPAEVPFGMAPASGFRAHGVAIGDIDNDGDLDVLLVEGEDLGDAPYPVAPRFVLFENTTGGTSPVFEVIVDPFGLSLPYRSPDWDDESSFEGFNTELIISPSLVDLDGDGDLDILMSGDEYYTDGQKAASFIYYENFGIE